MVKEKIKIKHPSKKSSLNPKYIKENNKNESSLINKAFISKKFLHKKRKNKNRINLDKIKQEKNKYNPKIKSNIQNIKTNSKEKEEEKNSIDDKIICAHLLLNSYNNTQTKDFLPGKTIKERMNTMRENIISLFPDIIN